MDRIRFSVAVTALLIGAGQVWGANTGFYVGGSVGSTQEHFDASTFNAHGSATGYQIAAGWRPLSVLAGEIDYVDFGRASNTEYYYQPAICCGSGSGPTTAEAYVDTSAVGIFALGYLPIPVVDLYGRLGAVDYRTDAHSPSLSFHRTGADLAYGAGAGVSFGNLGVRAEYTAYDVPHTHNLSLTSIGLTWTFL